LKINILIFTRGISTFSNENENEAIGIPRVSPKIFFFMHRAYADANIDTNRGILYVTM